MGQRAEVKSGGEGRRRFERIWGRIQAAFSLESPGGSGSAVWGVTRNIGLLGIYLVPSRTVSGLAPGLPGRVDLGMGPDKVSLSCRVVHTEGGGLGCELTSPPGDFAGVITRLLFGDGQFRLGAELPPEERVGVSLRGEGGVVWGGSLESISSGQVVALCPVPSVDAFAVGDSVEVSVKPGEGEAFAIRGVVKKRVVLPGSEREEPVMVRVAVVFFSPTSELQRQIKELVGVLHYARLARLVRIKAGTEVLGSRWDAPPNRDRDRIQGQLAGFFAHLQPRPGK
ncbi:MAG: hypothetical protein HQL57_05340 [Magnetococcales bacterium]|nr:hypothetical protein [Magnetococcales bacterium]MBF0156589.1 hypothetical protein [Magnetococcales bacterium]